MKESIYIYFFKTGSCALDVMVNVTKIGQ